MQAFHPNHVHTLVFDLLSLTRDFRKEDWDGLREILTVLEQRGFRLYAVETDAPEGRWSDSPKVAYLIGTPQALMQANPALAAEGVFWVTDHPETQSQLAEANCWFAGGNPEIEEAGGLHFQHFPDLLEILHPSRASARDFAHLLLDVKRRSPQLPLTVGFGGPDECGHVYVIAEVVEALEKLGQLVSGLDLTELLGVEFEGQADETRFWKNPRMRSWVLEEVLRPYSSGKPVVIESEPGFLEALEVTAFPFFAPPEGIMLVWGGPLFLPDFEQLIDLRVHLDLTPRTATARLFEIDEHEEFDKSFIESYQQREGRLYQKYLKEFDVENQLDYRIDFENLNAFRLKP